MVLVRVRGRGDAGFTLVETVVALGILAVIGVGLLQGVVAVTKASGDSQARVIAASIAAGALDEARLTAQTNIDAVVTASWTETVGGRSFTVLRSATWQTANGGSGCSGGYAGARSLLTVAMRVTWPGMGQTQPVRASTSIAPRSGSYDPALGNLSVLVTGADSSGRDLVSVTVTGPGTATAVTDDTGCAFFAGLSPGTYTVSASGAGMVNGAGDAAPTQSAGVVAAATTSVAVDLDAAATIVASLSPTFSGYPVATGTALTLANTSLAGGVRSTVPATWPATVSGVYPYAAGYTAWLGTCSDAAPGNAAVWPGYSAPLVAATPGGQTSVELSGAAMAVTVRDLLTDLPLAGVTVVARHSAEAGNGCTAGEVIPLGTTGADGAVRATIPYGTAWTIATTNLTIAGTTVVQVGPAGPYPAAVTLRGTL